MQCPTCGFENMPGNDGCARCGTSLRLSTTTMDVNPPRAGKAAKTWRRLGKPVMRIQMRRGRGRPAVMDFLVRARRRELPAYFRLWRLIVPGWTHFRDGQFKRGRLFFWGDLGSLLAGLVLFRSQLGLVFLGLAAGVHVVAMYDSLQEYLPAPPVVSRLNRAMIV